MPPSPPTVAHAQASPALRLFGTPVLHVDGATLRFAPERRFQLLAVLALADGRWVTREELGRLLLDAELAPQAADVLAALTAQDPANPRAHHLLSVALLQSGRRTEGMEEARRALRLDPRFVPAMHNLAMACIRERRWTRARYWLRQARAIDTEDASVRRLTLLLRLHAVGEAASWVWCFLMRRRPR